MRILGALLALALLHAGAACGEAEEGPTRTQVTLRVQGLEHAYFADVTHLQVEVFRKDARWELVSRVRLEATQLKLPLDLPIVPVSQHALNAPFEVIIDALDGDMRLAQTRVVASYAVNSLRLLEVWMHSCAGQPAACVQANCHGPECDVCDPVGECDPAGLSEGRELPFFDPAVLPAVKAAPPANP